MILTVRKSAFTVRIMKPIGDNVVLFNASISAGFPSPADDYLEQALDLNTFLIKKPSATFMAWVNGDSMIGAGIFNKDLLIIDRSLTPRHRSIVLAHLDGEFTLKRLIKVGAKIFLQPENPKYRSIEITEEMDFKIWGVLRHSVRMSFDESQ
jgi:DNA polymerase V